MLAQKGTQKGDSALIIALATGKTVRDAAASAHVAERTAWRRMQEPAFRQEVTNVRTMMISQAVGLLADAATDAVWTLRELLNSESDTVRLGAARAILEAGPRLRESDELASRIAALEAARDATNGG